MFFRIVRQGPHVAAPVMLALACSTTSSSGPLAEAGVDVVDPDGLQAGIVDLSSEGLLCPQGSVAAVVSDAAATVVLSRSVAGVQTAGCKLTFELDVPAGLSLGMPTTILRGVVFDETRLERRYAFEGAEATHAVVEQPPEDFVIVDRTDQLEAPSCGGSLRVRYVVDVAAQLLADGSFFQLDSVDLDTAFRFGTDWRSCDVDPSIHIAPGANGDFCDGPQQRPCAEGLRCDRERDPNAAEGSCVEQP